MLKTNTRDMEPRISMNIVICDDNCAFVSTLEREIWRYCKKKDWLVNIRTLTQPQKLLVDDLGSVQVVFLDVEMPGLNGLTVGRNIKAKYPEMILVLVTGFIDYAPAGYPIGVYRYLLKSRLGVELPLCLEDIHRTLLESNDYFKVTTRSGDTEIAVKNILFFEGSAHRSVFIHTLSSTIECPGKLADFDDYFKDKGFLRIQKSFLVNMAHISRIKSYYAYLSNGSVLKASQKNYSNVVNKYLTWKGKHS